MKISSTPSPSELSTVVVLSPSANNPVSTSATPATASRTAPIGRKRWNRPGASVAPSRTAAIGGTRVARHAGRRLATSVTRTPTSRPTTIVRVRNTSPLLGSVSPTASKILNRPVATPRPRNSPATAATSPVTSASSTTVPSTWRREAPSVRRVANSRVR